MNVDSSALQIITLTSNEARKGKNKKMDLKERGFEGIRDSRTSDRNQYLPCEHNNEIPIRMKDGKFLSL
jgi:hypothetical protein